MISKERDCIFKIKWSLDKIPWMKFKLRTQESIILFQKMKALLKNCCVLKNKYFNCLSEMKSYQPNFLIIKIVFSKNRNIINIWYWQKISNLENYKPNLTQRVKKKKLGIQNCCRPLNMTDREIRVNSSRFNVRKHSWKNNKDISKLN